MQIIHKYAKYSIKVCFLHIEQAFREFLVSPALISNLNGHKSVGLSYAKCKILTYFCDVIHICSFHLLSDRVSREVSIYDSNSGFHVFGDLDFEL